MSAPDPSAGLVIAERPRSITSLAARKGRAGDLAAAVERSFGLRLPEPGRFASGDSASATWIQPDVWLLEGEPGTLYGRAVAAVEASASVVDQSHGRSVLRLTGPASRAVLATCCRLDLHPRVFGPGSAAAALVGHVPCILRAFGGGFDVLVGSTYAQWLIEDFREAAAADGALFVPAAPPHRSAMPAAGSLR